MANRFLVGERFWWVKESRDCARGGRRKRGRGLVGNSEGVRRLIDWKGEERRGGRQDGEEDGDLATGETKVKESDDDIMLLSFFGGRAFPRIAPSHV